jgi:hypothetical protein
MNFNGKIKFLLFFLPFFEITTLATADDNFPFEGVKSNSIILPHRYKTLETKTSISISYVRLPEDWLEATIDAPIFQINNKIGLPFGFTLESCFQSIYISNQFRLGPHWNVEVGKFSFAAGIDAGILFGKMDLAGFNNKAKGWMLYPNASIGFSSKELAFTITAEHSTIQSLTLSSGNAETSDFKNLKSGQTIAIYIEQPLWNKHVMILGLINNFQKFYFPAWPAFSAFNKRYYIPQMFIGLVL